MKTERNEILVVHSPVYKNRSLCPYYRGHVIPSLYWILFKTAAGNKLNTQMILSRFIIELNKMGEFSKPTCLRKHKDWQILASKKQQDVFLVDFPIQTDNSKGDTAVQHELQLQRMH